MMKILKQTGIINIPRVNLGSCYMYFFGKEIENQHTSEADVLATEKVYLKLLEVFEGLKHKNATT